MIALEVTVNAEKSLTAGVGDDGVVTTIVTWVGGGPRGTKIDLHIGGLGNHENLLWANRDLQVGDVVQVRVVDVETPDEPFKREREAPALVERDRRRYYEELKKEYGE
jgi:hypothetical protein